MPHPAREVSLTGAVLRLDDLIQAGHYSKVRGELRDLFNSVIQSHIAQGTRPHHQVLTGFNTINSIVQRL